MSERKPKMCRCRLCGLSVTTATARVCMKCAHNLNIHFSDAEVSEYVIAGEIYEPERKNSVIPHCRNCGGDELEYMGIEASGGDYDDDLNDEWLCCNCGSVIVVPYEAESYKDAQYYDEDENPHDD